MSNRISAELALESTGQHRNTPPPCPKENPAGEQRKLEKNRLYRGDCQELLPSPQDRTVDSVTVVVELGPESLRVLAELQANLRRIADHFDPPPRDIVDTPYIAGTLGVTTTRIAQMVREGTIPKSCIVPGSGNGRLWKFRRRPLEEWLANR